MCTLSSQTQTHLVPFSFQVLELKKTELSQMVRLNVKHVKKESLDSCGFVSGSSAAYYIVSAQ